MSDRTIADENSEPSRPAQLASEFRESADGIVISAPQSKSAGCFLLLWLTGWTVGCVVLIGVVISDPSIGTIAFATPFWAAWLAVASWLVWCWFGKEILLVKHDEVLFLRQAIITLSTRVVPMSEVQRAGTCRSTHQENDAWLWGIEIETTGRPIQFGFRLSKQEREWLIHRLNAFGEFAVSGRFVAADDDLGTGPEHLSRWGGQHDELVQAPSDCAWAYEDLGTGIQFSRRGRLSLKAVFGLLFINLFWNGIVSVFVLGLFGLMPGDDGPMEGGEWWALFVFLIPFEVIGLVMLTGLVISIVEPFRKSEWIISDHEIVVRSHWPFFTWTKRWSTDNIGRMQQRERDPDQPQKMTTMHIDHTLNHELVFISDDNVDLCAISSLTQGEARWMAHLIRQLHPNWHA